MDPFTEAIISGGNAGGGNKLLPAVGGFLSTPIVGDVVGGATLAGIGSMLGSGQRDEEKKRRELEEKRLAHERLMNNLQLLMMATNQINRRIPGGG